LIFSGPYGIKSEDFHAKDLGGSTKESSPWSLFRIILFGRGAMAARQVLTLKIEVRVLAPEDFFPSLPLKF
jgi:hypothetical protein